MISKQPLIKKYAFILIAIIGILAYANTFNNTFQFDDGFHIVDGNKIKDFDNVLTLSHWKSVNNRPFSFFTLAVNYQINKLDVTGYHVANLLMHVLAGFMAFLLALEIMSLPLFGKNKTLKDYKVLIALFTAFIFVAHPIQTQAVTYIVQRMAVLAGFFYMWAVLLYIRGRNRHLQKEKVKPWEPYAYYAGAFFVGFLGFLSKQNAISFPLAFLLAEIFFIRTSEQKIDRKFLLAFSSVVGLIIILGIAVNGLPREFDKISRPQYLITQFRVMVKYWQLLFLPVNQNLDYFFPVSDTLLSVREMTSLAFLLGTIGLGVWLFRKKWYIVSFAIFWFYVTLSVESSIIPIRDVIYEHRLYIATFGFAFAISYLVFYLLSPKKASYPLIALSILTLVYVGASLNRNSVWKNPYTLWSDCVKKAPKRERAWYWLGTYYMTEKDAQNAIKCFDTSIDCNPGFPLAYNSRGNLRKDSDDLNGALEDYNTAIKLDPYYITAYYNRGITYAALNKLNNAIEDYDKSIALGNHTSAIYYNRGNAKRRTNDFEGAIEDYDISFKIDPNNPLCIFNRGLTKAKQRDHEEAIKDIDIAIKMDPANYLFYNGKGVSLIALQRWIEAINYFTKSLSINPNFGQAYYNRGYAKQLGLGDKEGACEDWSMAASKGYQSANYYLREYCK